MTLRRQLRRKLAKELFAATLDVARRSDWAYQATAHPIRRRMVWLHSLAELLVIRSLALALGLDKEVEDFFRVARQSCSWRPTINEEAG